MNMYMQGILVYRQPSQALPSRFRSRCVPSTGDQRRLADRRLLFPFLFWWELCPVDVPAWCCRIKLQGDRRMGKDELAAWACIRLDRLRRGLRFVHLFDAHGVESRGVLLVRIFKRGGSWSR